MLRKIGEGGMGVLYACQDSVLAREVAVKLLQRGLASEPQVVERLSEDAEFAVALFKIRSIDVTEKALADAGH